MQYILISKENELMHHGVEGQKWGKKNGPPYPLERLASDGETIKRDSDGNIKVIKKGSDYNGSSSTVSTKTKRRSNFNDSKEIIKKILNNDDAMNAYRVYTRIGQLKTDEILKKGQVLNTVTIDKDRDMSIPYFASYKNTDKIKYLGVYSGQLKKRMDDVSDGIYVKQTKLTKDIKIANRDSAKAIYEDLYKNNEKFRNGVNEINSKYGPDIWKHYKQKQVMKSAIKDGLSKDAYDAFNLNLTYHDDETNKIHNMFYKELKKNGFGAVLDLNDSQYSGYKSKAPIILFDTKKIVEDQVIRASNSQIDLAKLAAIGSMVLNYAALDIEDYNIDDKNRKSS